ncbi:MAG: protein disulfide oxidoreductase [Burkholderiales bacterium]|nr:protein disulfide oxidoreductase [Burkholderiales bacterium]
MNKWVRRGAEVLIFLLVLFSVRYWQQRDVPSGPAPVLEGRLLDGKVVPEFSGRPYLVHFWATWCPICKTEEASIDAISKHYPVLTVALKSGQIPEVEKYMREHSLGFPVLNDPEGEISSSWGIHAVPASFVIGPEGKIRFVEFGYTSSIGLKARLWLAGLI